MTKREIIAVMENIKKEGIVSVQNYKNLEEAIATLKTEVGKSAAKSAGKADVFKACNEVLKNAAKMNNRALQGAFILPDGKQYVCDGHICIQMENILELPPIKLEEGVKPLDCSKFFENLPMEKIADLPDMVTLKNRIKQVKAEAKISGKRCPTLICKIAENCFVNPELLLTAIKATGAGELYSANCKTGKLYLYGEGVTAIVLPIRPNSIVLDMSIGSMKAL